MNRKIVPVVLVMFFLVQGLTFPREAVSETCNLNPPIRVSMNESRFSFRTVYNVLNLALFVYKLDTVGEYSKERLISECGKALSGPDIKFDLDQIDVGRKGWTRYYPFCVGRKYFVARIFLSKERFYQPRVEVLYEAVMSNPAVTFQILPDLNTILKGCGIKPRNAFQDTETVSSL